MRIALACLILFGLLFAEACHQRHQHMMRVFLVSLETMSASLGDLTIAHVAFHKAALRAATAMRRVAEEGYRRAGRP